MTDIHEKANELFYDQSAQLYDSSGSINSDGNRNRIQRLLEKLASDHVGSDDKSLDICCGTGLYLSYLKQFFKEENLYGCDISSAMIQLAQRYCQNVQKASVYELPYADNNFRLVTASSALHHLSDIPKVLSEVYRVLVPGGIFLADYDNSYHYARFMQIKSGLKKIIQIKPATDKILGRFKPILEPDSDKNNSKQSEVQLPIQDMSHQELHDLAEPQNIRKQGINGIEYKKIAESIGFTSSSIHLFSTNNWNDGKPFNLIRSLNNNKVYSISRK